MFYLKQHIIMYILSMVKDLYFILIYPGVNWSTQKTYFFSRCLFTEIQGVFLILCRFK